MRIKERETERKEYLGILLNENRRYLFFYIFNGRIITSVTAALYSKRVKE